jgi:hypothetical protein
MNYGKSHYQPTPTDNQIAKFEPANSQAEIANHQEQCCKQAPLERHEEQQQDQEATSDCSPQDTFFSGSQDKLVRWSQDTRFSIAQNAFVCCP